MNIREAIIKEVEEAPLSRGWELKRTHDLEDLLNAALSYDREFELFRDACRFTTEFYIEQRYPFLPSPSPSKEEFEEAMQGIQQMIEYIRQKIQT